MKDNLLLLNYFKLRFSDFFLIFDAFFFDAILFPVGNKIEIPVSNLKGDFQSILYNLVSLFALFLLIYVRRHKMQHFATSHMK